MALQYRKSFWIGLGIFSVVVIALYAFVIRPWHMRWGASDQEIVMALLGDADIPRGAEVSTRALTIHAPAPTVWAWLIQTGQNRGGDWYSYEWLENLFAAEMRSIEKIDARWQSLRVGDQWYYAAGGKSNPAMVGTITRLEPGRALALQGWSFVVQPIDANTTRLIVRYPLTGETFGNAFFSFAIFEPAHFAMESGMMLGIKHHAERDPQMKTQGAQ